MIKHIVVILIFLFSATLNAESNSDNKLQLENKSLPDIQWQDVDGRTHYLKETEGQPRLLHFWAAWCSPCRKELPEMLEWTERNKDILMIPLSLDQRMTQSKYFIKKYKLEMTPLLLDQDSSDALKIPALPYTIFVAADGTSIGQFHGIAPWQDDEFTQLVRNKFKLD